MTTKPADPSTSGATPGGLGSRTLASRGLAFLIAAALGIAFALTFAPATSSLASLAVLAGYAALVLLATPTGKGPRALDDTRTGARSGPAEPTPGRVGSTPGPAESTPERAGSTTVAGKRRPSPRAPGALVLGGGFGLGWFCTGIGWLYISMHEFGELPAPIAALAVVLLALYLSIYLIGATRLAILALERRGPLAFAVVFGAATVIGEWLRGTVFTGLPWLAVGYGQTDGPLAGFAPLVGVFGVGGLAMLVAALAAVVVVGLVTGRRIGSRSGGRFGRRDALAVLIILAVVGGGAWLGSVRWTAPVGRPLDVRLIQGNVAQQMKFDPEHALAAMGYYTEAIEAEAASRPDLILLPETAWIVPWQRTPPALAERVIAAVRSSGATVALGLPLYVDAAPGAAPEPWPALTNSILAISPDPAAPGGVRMMRYDKRHLVPFGEFVPPGFRWFVDMMRIPLGDFDRGKAGQPPFEVGGQQLAGLVCYEDAFGDEVAAAVAGQPTATMLANVTNVAWFGRSRAADQHLQMARMRTLETGRPMIRATNTGMTAAIDADGRIIAEAPPFERTTIAARVQGHAGLTPYVRSGDLTALVLAAVALVAVAAARPSAGASRRQARDRASS